MLRKFAARVEALTAARVRIAAQEKCAAAKARAPVDTGRLRNSIRAESDGLTARVIADCEYAAAVEFGTGRAAPQPFMRGEMD